MFFFDLGVFFFNMFGLLGSLWGFLPFFFQAFVESMGFWRPF